MAFLQEYPVLARQLLLGIDQWLTSSVEFLHHLCQDREQIRNSFSPGREPGLLAQLEGGLGDRHRGGRSVMLARFHSGFQLVYKPRPLALDVQFQALLAWLNDRGDHPVFRTWRRGRDAGLC